MGGGTCLRVTVEVLGYSVHGKNKYDIKCTSLPFSLSE
jgi:hypothetical protein